MEFFLSKIIPEDYYPEENTTSQVAHINVTIERLNRYIKKSKKIPKKSLHIIANKNFYY